MSMCKSLLLWLNGLLSNTEKRLKRSKRHVKFSKGEKGGRLGGPSQEENTIGMRQASNSNNVDMFKLFSAQY